MNNNDILRRIRYTFDLNDASMIELFGLADQSVTRAEVSDWLRKEGEDSFEVISDTLLATFLNGFIVHKRGPKEGPKPVPEKVLTNNAIFRKLKIALHLKNEDVIKLFALVDKKISPHELSSFFRKPTHAKYRICQDQYLRNFLTGLQAKYRDASSN